MAQPPLRIAMWSGPRTISSAMMRSWGNRPDTVVCDEPLYAHYLRETRRPHPGAREVVEHHEADWRKVVAGLTGDLPEGKTIFYQKQMAHHLLPSIERGWLDRVTNCFLIREPYEMLTSLIHFIPNPTIEDTGLLQQAEVFSGVRQRTGRIPPVVDSREVLDAPRAVLGRLCEALDVPFTEAMLSWPPGRRSTDGIWAKHWYAAVEKTTSFKPYAPKNETLPKSLEPLYEQCRVLYQSLHKHRLAP